MKPINIEISVGIRKWPVMCDNPPRTLKLLEVIFGVATAQTYHVMGHLCHDISPCTSS